MIEDDYSYCNQTPINIILVKLVVAYVALTNLMLIWVNKSVNHHQVVTVVLKEVSLKTGTEPVADM